MRKIKALLGVFLLCGVTGCSKKSNNDFKFEGKGYSKGNINYYYNNKKNKWYEVFKEEEIYDLTGKQLYHVFYQTKNGELQLSALHTFKYNDNNQLIEKDIDEYVVKDGENVLSPVKRIEYTYEGTILTQTTTFYKSYVSNGDLKLSSKNEYLYDENNNLKKETVSSYDKDSDTWKEDRIEEYTYDSASNILSHIINSYSIIAPYNEATTYEYDANNNVIKETYECNDSNGNTKTETIKTYENNLLKNEKGFDLVTVSDKEIWATDYTYDSNNNLLSKTIRYNDKTTGRLLMAEKNDYKYDSNNELKTDTHSLTEVEPYEWYSNRKLEYFTKEYK